MGNSTFSFAFTRNNVEVVGTKNGVNATFTIPFSEIYIPASLMVRVNGQLLQQSSIQKNGPGYTTFTILSDIIPIAEDVITASYSVATS